MDVVTYNEAKTDLEHAYLTHMIDREEYYLELKELRKERQDDRELLLEPVKSTEIEKPPATQRRLYVGRNSKVNRSRRRQYFFLGHVARFNRKLFNRRR